jgi:aspartyl-tRNA(Asn)/glutamyl-tRNA(Gln) amidotransferase subunit A
LLQNFIPSYDAEVVANLAKSGCIMLGKTNMDEFAMGSSNENSFYGPVKNPWDLQSVPGGCSGGSAASVAAHLTMAATGTDAGGSVRQPAAFCGVTGIKPTYDLISREGIISFAPTFDHAGILARNAEDTAILLNGMITSVRKDQDYTKTLNNSLRNLTVGLLKEYFSANLETGVAIALDEAITILEKLGAKIKEISLPNISYSMAAYRTISLAESAKSFASFIDENQKDLKLDISASNNCLGREMKRRILLGTNILSPVNYESYYIKAQKVRKLIADDFQKAFQSVDVILGPTTPNSAFKLGDKTKDPVSMYLSDICTTAGNMTGLPAISIPIGFSESLPVGMHLIGNYFNEDLLLNVAHKYQQETDWHNRIPENF